MPDPIKTVADYMEASPEQRQLWEAALQTRPWLRDAPANKLRNTPNGAVVTIGEVVAVTDTSFEVRAGDVVLFNQLQAVRSISELYPLSEFPVEIWSLDGRHTCHAMVSAVILKFERKHIGAC